MLSGQPGVPEPNPLVTKAAVDITKTGVQELPRAVRSVTLGEYRPPVPDVIGYLQRETELTRATLAEILLKSGRVNEALKNPQVFMERTAGAIGHAKHELMVDGIKYERIAGQS